MANIKEMAIQMGRRAIDFVRYHVNLKPNTKSQTNFKYWIVFVLGSFAYLWTCIPTYLASQISHTNRKISVSPVVLVVSTD